ncbi:27077_t:CDS:2 [Gigaspora margarita]|uniref:27077_t:CDS:1 n=1 Tax=Gigaspora margarita TaxID=4874 RepID=A0ABN7W776_GIGMA|nr:27077_t:CDS:2 [Gigaspora margarita]
MTEMSTGRPHFNIEYDGTLARISTKLEIIKIEAEYIQKIGSKLGIVEIMAGYV